MTAPGAGRAVLLVAASAAVMAGTVFLVNIPRYGAVGGLVGAMLALGGLVLAVRVFRAGGVAAPVDGGAGDPAAERREPPPSATAAARAAESE